jgi:HTTM domain
VPTLRRILRGWQTEIGDAYAVSLVRAIFGVLLALSALREMDELRSGAYFGDVFHLPMVPETLVPSRTVFMAIVVTQLVCALGVVAGRFARPLLLVSAVLGIYLLLCDRLSYHNNRYALFLFSFLLAFAPCDRAFVLRARNAEPADRMGPLWAQRLAQLQLAIIYVASGGSKLFDPDWRSGFVIGDRLLRASQMAAAKGVPPELMQMLSQPAVASAVSKLAIFTELFLAVGLFVPKTRFFALWWGVMFHITIEITSKVELFGWLSITTYALFAIPRVRERSLVFDPESSHASALARLVRSLDWLARFEVRPQHAGNDSPTFAVIDRDGSSASGLLGIARIARATPVLFPLSVPLLLLAKLVARRGDPSAAANLAK